jgi:virginiamycin B lyase
MMRVRALAATLLVSSLAACGGAGGSALTTVVPATPIAAARASTTVSDVTIDVIIRDAARTRRDHFISRSTAGVLAQVYAHADKKHKHLLGKSATNVAAGSPACGGKKGYPRACTVSVPAPAGNDDFVFTTYDAPPKAGKFPKTAHVLGLGALTQRIVGSKANRLAIYISGVIASIGAGPAFASLAADGKSQSYGFILQPQDFNDNPISAGVRDPYANPISLSLAETGGSGHAALSLNGGAAAPSIVSTRSTDRIVMNYDGGGTPGYGVVVTISAKGVAPQSVALSPLFVASASTLFANGALDFYTSAQQAALNVTELNAPSSTQYTATPSGCSGVASAGAVRGSGADASVVVTSGSSASASGCEVAVSDGASTVHVPITNTTTGGGVTVPNVTIAEFPIPTANAKVSHIVAGSDGALWFAECNLAAGKIGRIPANATAGSGAQIAEYPVPTAAAGPFAIVAAADSAIWFSERGNDSVGRIPTTATPGSSAQIAEYPAGSPFTTPSALLAGPSGNIWFTDQTQSDAGVMNLGGGVAQTVPLAVPGNAMAQDASGNVWIGTVSTGQLFEVAPGGTVTSLTVPVASQIVSMTFDGSGNLWMADAGMHAIDELPSGATSITQFTLPQSGSPGGLTVGPDGAIWFTDTARNAIGRMTPSGTFAPLAGYAIPTAASTPVDIVNGPDGALWFVENAGNNIGRIVPSGSTGASAARKALIHSDREQRHLFVR